jgi:FkbM family methyltransferase
MIPTTTLTLLDGVRIVVPDSLDLITPYVLREQQDWFEDEIKFMRRLLQPGQKVIDIGANYGVYTLCLAKVVGPTGHVWAFEPASSTAKVLAEGIAANCFSQITLEQAALSNISGTAQLSLDPDSELNAVVHDQVPSSVTETVALVSLDDCLERYGWQDIDFLKIDAEGEEANILRGGKRFFAELSPLVQYEVKAGVDMHLELVEAFAALGYDSYRLVPGLDLLVPFDAKEQQDGYLLNLFSCKPDCASKLAARGVILESEDQSAGKVSRQNSSQDLKTSDVYDWRNTLSRLPYGEQLADLWEQRMIADQNKHVQAGLSLYATSRDCSLTPGERYRALAASLLRFSFVCEREPSGMRLASLARVARDYGARTVAVNALVQLINTIFEQNRVDLSEPFLAPGERFDSVPPGEDLGKWVVAAILEELERLEAFSSFYLGDSARKRLEMIRDLSFGSAEMERRLELLQERFGLTSDKR